MARAEQTHHHRSHSPQRAAASSSALPSACRALRGWGQGMQPLCAVLRPKHPARPATTRPRTVPAARH
eukprot:6190571-Pleurochrysis_carterae.AAC.6